MKAMRTKQYGGVSIFIVVFTALLVTVVTSSFAQVMLKTQQQAQVNDLSQSAYDAALAGVEDAKRALVALRKCENEKNTSCVATIRSKLESQQCDSLNDITTKFNNGEVEVNPGLGLNQAYTCVKVDLSPKSVSGDILSSTSEVHPLSSNVAFDKIRISWFTKNNLQDKRPDGSGGEFAEQNSISALPSQYPGLPSSNATPPSGWPKDAPAMMRLQLIQFKKGDLNLSNFSNEGTNNAKTMFLYPSPGVVGSSNNFDFGIDSRRLGGGNTPQRTICSTTFAYDGTYACQATISLPSPDGGSAADREAYLQLQTYYQNLPNSYKIELLSGSTVVDFNEVQPTVDSTGRASTLFKRVKANVSIRNRSVPFEYPTSELTLEGNLCKTFFVGDEAGEYQDNATRGTQDCEP